MSQFSESDLEAVVREALVAEHEVPAEWRQAARAAYTWRSVDQELLSLTYDSLLDASVAVRGDGDGRTLEFAGGGLTLEVELTGGRVLGQLGGLVASEVALERADGGRRSITSDESGFFSLEGEGPGLVRFTVRTGEAQLVTEWVAL